MLRQVSPFMRMISIKWCNQFEKQWQILFLLGDRNINWYIHVWCCLERWRIGKPKKYFFHNFFAFVYKQCSSVVLDKEHILAKYHNDDQEPTVGNLTKRGRIIVANSMLRHYTELWESLLSPWYYVQRQRVPMPACVGSIKTAVCGPFSQQGAFPSHHCHHYIAFGSYMSSTNWIFEKS